MAAKGWVTLYSNNEHFCRSMLDNSLKILIHKTNDFGGYMPA